MKWTAILMLFLSSLAFAGGEGEPCSHPVFVTHECLGTYVPETGTDGTNGQDGLNGADGADGATGPMGPQGPAGPGGVSSNSQSSLTANLSRYSGQYYDYLAATEAAQVYLPQNQDSRVTFGVSTVNGTTGLGIGYARRFEGEDAPAFTLALGTAGGETTAKASFGFEF